MKKRVIASVLAAVTAVSSMGVLPVMAESEQTSIITENFSQADTNGTTITFWHSMGGVNGEAMDYLVNKFNEENTDGITVEAVYCPGHTPGSTFFWIHGCDVLITGDGCNYFTMLQDKFCLTVSEYEKHLMHAIERTKGKYTDIYLSHGQVIVPSSLLENVVLVCKEIEAGIDDKVPFEFMGVKGMVAKAFGSSGGSGYMRLDGGFGNIVYNPERIWQQ